MRCARLIAIAIPLSVDHRAFTDNHRSTSRSQRARLRDVFGTVQMRAPLVPPSSSTQPSNSRIVAPCRRSTRESRRSAVDRTGDRRRAHPSSRHLQEPDLGTAVCRRIRHCLSAGSARILGRLRRPPRGSVVMFRSGRIRKHASRLSRSFAGCRAPDTSNSGAHHGRIRPH
jgi:hypothetical protein